MDKKYGNVMALKEFMLNNNRVSKIEALVLFGVQDLNREIKRMRMDGFIIKNQKVTMVKILTRLNKFTVCKSPKELPIKEIIMNEFWISR